MPRRTTPLDQHTTVRLGLALSAAGVLIGAIWWAATINAKMDLVINGFKDLERRTRDLETAASNPRR